MLIRAPIAEWKNDDRKSSTTSDLLHELDWLGGELQHDLCATKMLFQAENMGRYN
jgi:hypothetical protein